MPHEQLSLEESWQLPVFSKPGKQGEAGAGWRSGRGSGRALGGLWEGTGMVRQEHRHNPGFCSHLKPTQNNPYKGRSQELLNRWGCFYSSSTSFCFSSSKSQLWGTWEDIRNFYTTHHKETSINKCLLWVQVCNAAFPSGSPCVLLCQG